MGVFLVCCVDVWLCVFERGGGGRNEWRTVVLRWSVDDENWNIDYEVDLSTDWPLEWLWAHLTRYLMKLRAAKSKRLKMNEIKWPISDSVFFVSLTAHSHPIIFTHIHFCYSEWDHRTTHIPTKKWITLVTCTDLCCRYIWQGVVQFVIVTLSNTHFEWKWWTFLNTRTSHITLNVCAPNETKCIR